MGILDQISILRSPATADLKQIQYSTKMVQSSPQPVTKVYYLCFKGLSGSKQHFALQLLISGLRESAQFFKPVWICDSQVKASLSLHGFFQGRRNSV